MSKDISVLLISPIAHQLPPSNYGPWELVTYNLIQSLTKMGVKVTVYATKQSKINGELLFYWNNSLDKLEESDRSNAMKIHIAEAMLKAKDYDLVHNLVGFDPLFFSKQLPTPIVTTLHGTASERKNRILLDYFKQQKFISISFSERNFAPNLNYVGNVYHGVDFSNYTQKQNKGEYLVFNGRITREKGIEDSIEFAKHFGIPLKIAGVITDENYFESFVKPHLKSNLIEYIGNIDRTQMNELMQKAIALLFFIHWDEPFGLSLLDALACGVPVIGYKRGSLPEVIYDKQMGNLVNNLDEAKEVFLNLKFSSPLIIRQLTEEKFNTDKMGKEYLEIYNQTLK